MLVVVLQRDNESIDSWNKTAGPHAFGNGKVDSGYPLAGGLLISGRSAAIQHPDGIRVQAHAPGVAVHGGTPDRLERGVVCVDMS